MSHSKDTDPHQIDEHRELLIDLLYGELGDDVAAQAEERVRGDAELSEELGALSRVRAMMQELPEEEPPAAITAKLLHAAALQGPAATGRQAGDRGDERKGLWAWLKSLFRPIVMFPGLAAATSLVLVAGIAGVFYATDRMSEPAMYAADESASKPSAPASTSVADPALPSEKAREPQAEPEQVEADKPSLEASGRTARGDTDDLADQRLERPKATPPASKKPRKRSKRKADSSFGKISGDYKDIPAAKNENRRRSGGANAPGSSDRAAPRSKPASGKKRPRRSRTRGAPSDSISVGTETPALEPLEDDADSEAADEGEALEIEEEKRGASEAQKSRDDNNRARLRSLRDEARAAGRNDDCDSVAKIAERIRSIDSRYYREEILGDRSLSKCFGKKTKR